MASCLIDENGKHPDVQALRVRFEKKLGLKCLDKIPVNFISEGDYTERFPGKYVNGLELLVIKYETDLKQMVENANTAKNKRAYEMLCELRRRLNGYDSNNDS